MNPTNQKLDLIIKNVGELLTLSSSFKEESGLGMIRNGALAVKEWENFLGGENRGVSSINFVETKGEED